MKLSVVTGASFVSSRQVNVPILVSNTAFAGLGSGFFSVSFPQALKEKQTTRHRHKSKTLRKANPPYFQRLADSPGIIMLSAISIFSVASSYNKLTYNKLMASHTSTLYIINKKGRREKCLPELFHNRKSIKKKGCLQPFFQFKSNTQPLRKY